jgi:ABC-type nitrate/sulfonate/bicarbonate transport system substrate-binding protein
MGMVFPVSTHNYELRYWLAAGGLHPGYYAPHKGDTSGPQRRRAALGDAAAADARHLEAGTINGYCVGEPWNQQAVFRGIGVPVITDYDIRKNMSEKVFGVSNAWAEKHPNTHKAVVKALIRAGKWLDEENNKPTARRRRRSSRSPLRRRRLRGHRQQHDRPSSSRRATSAPRRTSTCSSATTPPIPTTRMPSGT